MSRIYVIHENEAWTAPLCAALSELGLPYREWFVDGGRLDLGSTPPEGVFYNRMSASAHTRGHRYAPEYTACLLGWLESHGRRVINSGRALRLELSKVAQYEALDAFGIRTPRTVAAVGRQAIVEAATLFEGRFITKPNRAGKGLGVRLFEAVDELSAYVEGPEFEDSIDGITLVQQYIEAPEPFITRVEFIGGRFFYAVRVETAAGFELCPADACRIDDGARSGADDSPSGFRIIEGFEHPNVERYARLLAANGAQIAGVEFIVDAAGEAFTYDINATTNFSAEAEAAAGRYGMRAVAAYLGDELAGLEDTGDRARAASAGPAALA